MSKQAPSFVDPDILLWNPDLLWAGYLQLRRQARDDFSPDKLELPVFKSPKALGERICQFHHDCKDDDGLKLRWQILFAFGYEAGKEWQTWAQGKTREITGKIASVIDKYVKSQKSAEHKGGD